MSVDDVVYAVVWEFSQDCLACGADVEGKARSDGNDRRDSVLSCIMIDDDSAAVLLDDEVDGLAGFRREIGDYWLDLFDKIVARPDGPSEFQELIPRRYRPLCLTTNSWANRDCKWRWTVLFATLISWEISETPIHPPDCNTSMIEKSVSSDFTPRSVAGCPVMNVCNSSIPNIFVIRNICHKIASSIHNVLSRGIFCQLFRNTESDCDNLLPHRL